MTREMGHQTGVSRICSIEHTTALERENRQCIRLDAFLHILKHADSWTLFDIEGVAKCRV